MDDALLDVVLARLERVPLGERAASLLLAACASDEALAAEIAGEPDDGIEHCGSHTGVEPAGAYLRSVTVSGFRGVGPSATLDLTGGPGLTLVVGRNGSGKSSFAEGLEVLLTGELRRWQELTASWREGWRNLHAPDPAQLSAELLVEGVGQATVQRSWDPDVSLGQSRVWVQVGGEKRAGMDRLGWHDAVVTYRPFLSHSELEAFLGGPSHLYDLLSSVLGLEDLTAAGKRLTDARKQRDDGLKAVKLELPALLGRLDAVDDERARSCRQALAEGHPDLEGALSMAAGSSVPQPHGEISRLRQLSHLTVPGEEQVRAAVTALREAADTLAEVTGSQVGQALALAGLLRSALEHYHSHGPGPCPVCGRVSALDERWRARTEHQITRLEEQGAHARSARSRAADAKAEARNLFLPVPAVLAQAAVGPVDPEHARSAWTAWLRLPDDPPPDGLRELASHIEQAWPALSAAVTALAECADAELMAREDLWAPVAKDVVAWCERAHEAETAARDLPAIKAAITWLKNATDDIRNERLAPLGDQSRAIWSRLRQESNVDLGAIRLSGSGPARKVDVKVTVDGTAGAALGVMSQGEVNALALSIFLPRATVAASPFRFLVIDDPVQAMDPAKVEGLARVLEDVSKTRQVLVFTHDDRLPEAVRRLGIAATILEVTRRPGSVVAVRPVLTPVDRQLKDALDLCADNALPPAIAGRVVPGLCRLAVEAAFTEAIRHGQLRAGKRHAEVEAAIEAAGTLSRKAALAMFGDASRAGDVLSRLNSWHPAAADTFRALNKGAHGGQTGPLRPLVNETRALTRLVGQKLS